MFQIRKRFNLCTETLQLAVQTLDRVLTSKKISVTKENLQVTGIAALLIAAKFEEVYLPSIYDLEILSNTKAGEILKMESKVNFCCCES